jgi:hypothetical protein
MEKSFNAGTFKFIENWEFVRINNLTGEILDKSEYCNAIVNDGLERVAKLINNVNSTYFRGLAIGTGTNAVTNTDTALQTETDRALATLSYEASYKAKFNKTFIFGSGVSRDISEAGIFDNETSGGAMLSRVIVSPAKHVDSTISLIVTATITVARV